MNLNQFDAIEVHGCKEFEDIAGFKFTEQVPDNEATFYSVYGHYKPQCGQGIECIFDFDTKEHAENYATELTKQLTKE